MGNMTLENSLSQLTRLACTFSWMLMSFMPVSTQATSVNTLAQGSKPKPNNNPKPNSGKNIKIVQPNPPRQGTPDNRGNAGPRPGCAGKMLPQPLTALVPESTIVTQPNNQKSQLPWGKATEKHPTFWFYMPYGDKIHSTKFILKDKIGKEVYRARVPITTSPGIIRVSLPPEAKPLENGKWYEASFSVKLKCPSTTIENSVTAWVFREDLSNLLKQQLEQQPKLQQAIFYAQNGFWYDVLAKVVELKQKNLDDGGWRSLLDSAALGAMENKRLVECCTPETQQSP
jgi:Domain of Unknown Function (DUF928)